MSDWTNVDGKVVGGNGGEGVLIESLTVKKDQNVKTKEDMLWLEIAGTANTVLHNSYSPEAGYAELSEPLPISHRIDLLGSATKDLSITFDMLNRAFDFPKPLVDREDEVLRFLEDADDSVYKNIVGQRCFFKMKMGQGKTGSKPSDFFANPQSQSKVIESKVASVKEELKKVKAKKAAKEAAMNAGGDFARVGSSEPIPF